MKRSVRVRVSHCGSQKTVNAFAGAAWIFSGCPGGSSLRRLNRCMSTRFFTYIVCQTLSGIMR